MCNYTPERDQQKGYAMQLTGPEIKNVMNIPNPHNPDGHPDIVIKPFFDECLGSNSYDLHLSPVLKVYEHTLPHNMKPIIEYDPNKPMHEYSMSNWFERFSTYEDYMLRPHQAKIGRASCRERV